MLKTAPLNSCLEQRLLTQPPPEPTRVALSSRGVRPLSRSRVSRVILRSELNALAGGLQIMSMSRKPPISLYSSSKARCGRSSHRIARISGYIASEWKEISVEVTL